MSNWNVHKKILNKLNSKIILFSVVIGVITIIAGIIGYNYYSVKSNTIPEQVSLSTISPNSFTITFFTNKKAKAELVVSKNKDFSDSQTFFDERDVQIDNSGEQGERKMHFLVARNLEPEQTYYYKVQTPLNTKYEEDTYNVQTRKVEKDVPTPYPIFGEIVDKDNISAPNIIVDIYAFSEETGFISNTISTYTNWNGTYSADLANLVTEEGYFDMNQEGVKVVILPRNQEESYFLEVESNNLTPAPVVKMKQANEEKAFLEKLYHTASAQDNGDYYPCEEPHIKLDPGGLAHNVDIKITCHKTEPGWAKVCPDQGVQTFDSINDALTEKNAGFTTSGDSKYQISPDICPGDGGSSGLNTTNNEDTCNEGQIQIGELCGNCVEGKPGAFLKDNGEYIFIYNLACGVTDQNRSSIRSIATRCTAEDYVNNSDQCDGGTGGVTNGGEVPTRDLYAPSQGAIEAVTGVTAANSDNPVDQDDVGATEGNVVYTQSDNSDNQDDVANNDEYESCPTDYEVILYQPDPSLPGKTPPLHTVCKDKNDRVLFYCPKNTFYYRGVGIVNSGCYTLIEVEGLLPCNELLPSQSSVITRYTTDNQNLIACLNHREIGFKTCPEGTVADSDNNQVFPNRCFERDEQGIRKCGDNEILVRGGIDGVEGSYCRLRSELPQACGSNGNTQFFPQDLHFGVDCLNTEEDEIWHKCSRDYPTPSDTDGNGVVDECIAPAPQKSEEEDQSAEIPVPPTESSNTNPEVQIQTEPGRLQGSLASTKCGNGLTRVSTNVSDTKYWCLRSEYVLDYSKVVFTDVYLGNICESNFIDDLYTVLIVSNDATNFVVPGTDLESNIPPGELFALKGGQTNMQGGYQCSPIDDIVGEVTRIPETESKQIQRVQNYSGKLDHKTYPDGCGEDLTEINAFKGLLNKPEYCVVTVFEHPSSTVPEGGVCNFDYRQYGVYKNRLGNYVGLVTQRCASGLECKQETRGRTDQINAGTCEIPDDAQTNSTLKHKSAIKNSRILGSALAQESSNEVLPPQNVQVQTGDVVDPGKYQTDLDVELNFSQPKEVKFYNDANGNGERDEGEEFIEDRQFEIVKTKEAFNYTINQGWNAINIPAFKDQNSFYKASDLIDKSVFESVNITSIKKWEGKWIEFNVVDEVGYGEDFNILPNQGYFIFAQNAGDINLFGAVPTRSYPMSLNAGWSLIGVSGGFDENLNETFANDAFNSDGIDAFEFLETINSSQTSLGVNNMTRWDSGVYRGVNIQEGKNFGIDFNVGNLEAYFIRSDERGVFTP